MMGGFLRLAIQPHFWLIVAAGVGLGWIYGQVNYWRGHAAGYDLGERVTKANYEAALEDERARVDAANAEARARQRKQYENLIDLIRRKDALLEELDHEAEHDPRAPECGMSGDGLRRINRS